MEAKELRLGNWVCDRPGLALQVNLNHFLEKWFWDALERAEITPIPLAEEWALKFGFEPERPGHFFKGSFIIKPDNILAYRLKNDVLYLKCKYVHQLQNLYFALTGEELELKPVQIPSK